MFKKFRHRKPGRPVGSGKPKAPATVRKYWRRKKKEYRRKRRKKKQRRR